MKPILFNTEMVQAILDGRKSVTRRVVKPQPNKQLVPEPDGGCWPGYFAEVGTPSVANPPYRPGDILYVREATWKWPGGYEYKADYAEGNPGYIWTPSIHMTKEAARLFLRVTNVRVERLQEITDEQAAAEGCKGWFVATKREWDKNPDYITEFRSVWNSTLKKADLPRYGWDADPWVWVIEFERIGKEEALEKEGGAHETVLV